MTALMALGLLAGCNDAPRKVTYYEHVKPILEDHCVRCHQPGGIGGLDLTPPDSAVTYAAVIANATGQGIMPPPVADPECRDYVGSEHLALSRRDQSILDRWVELDAPLGDPADAHSGTWEPAELDDADLSVRIPAYAPSYDDERNPDNEYRCFVLEHGRDDDFFVTALHPLVDKESIVHHMVLGAVDRGSLGADFDRTTGEDCIDDDMGAVENMLAAWAPGSQPSIFQEGSGMRVGADQVLILQMHYFLPGPEADGLIDESGYALRTQPTVDTPLEVMTLGSTSFRIPAGDDDYRFAEGYRPERELKLHGVFPHMHTLGRSYRMWLGDDGPGDCAVAADRYDFHNQLTYLFREPMTVQAGESISWECGWDNSPTNPDRLIDESQDVFYGERSDEEMCFFFSIVESE